MICARNILRASPLLPTSPGTERRRMGERADDERTTASSPASLCEDEGTTHHKRVARHTTSACKEHPRR